MRDELKAGDFVRWNINSDNHYWRRIAVERHRVFGNKLMRVKRILHSGSVELEWADGSAWDRAYRFTGENYDPWIVKKDEFLTKAWEARHGKEETTDKSW